MSEQMLADPKLNEEGGYLSGIREEYNALDPTVRRMLSNQNAHRPNGGLRAFMEGRIASTTSPKRINTIESINDVMREFERKKSTVEDTSGVKINVEKVENADAKKDSVIRSIFRKHPGQLRLEVQEGLYGSINDTPKENMDAAVAYYKDKVDFESNYSKTREGSGASDKEINTTSENWYKNITSNNDVAFQNAADYLVGQKMPDGTNIEGVVRVGKEDGTEYADGEYMVIQTTSKSKMMEEIVLEDNDERTKVENKSGKSFYYVRAKDIRKKQFLTDLYKNAVKKGKKDVFSEDFTKTKDNVGGYGNLDPLGRKKKNGISF